MMKVTGIATEKELNSILPSESRIEKCPFVILECFEQIPCNPCMDACPKGAIKIEDNINNLPKVDFDKCNGCGICVSSCPGLAIFVVQKNYSETSGTVMIPYEFTPIPQVGEIVDGLSREGYKICDAKVLRVLYTKKQDRTAVITIEVPKDLIMEVRNIKPRTKKQL
ncbi:MAG: 4Fe-4S binding protein [bacterium]|nr:4Fe-4S binding protein [bacterium]